MVLGPGLEAQVLTWMCYGGPDTINWSYILPDDGRVIHIPTNKQECCPCSWSLIVLKDKIVVPGPGLGLGAQVLVTISGYAALACGFNLTVYLADAEDSNVF